MKRLILLAALLLCTSWADARDLVARSPVSQPRSLRTDVADNPPIDPPPGGGGGGEQPPPVTDVRGCENCTTLTATETIPTLTNGLTLIGVCQRSATDIITSVSGSVDGALTLVSTANDAANNLVRANLYRLIAPTAGAQVFTVTSSAGQNMAMGVAHFSNVDQTTPLGTITNTAGTGNPTTTYSSATQRVVVDHLCAALSNEYTVVPASGQEQQWFSTAGIIGFPNRISTMSKKAGAASVNMDWTKSTATAVGHIQQVIDVRPPGDTGDPPSQCQSCYILNNNFEDSVFARPGGILVTCCLNGESQEIVTSPVRTGTKALRMKARSDVTVGDTDPPVRAGAPSWVWSGNGRLVRAEIQQYNLGLSHGDIERWYGFAVYVPDATGFPVPNLGANELPGVAQWHSNNDACDVAKSPHFAIQITNTMRWRARNIWDANACTTFNPPNSQTWDLGAITRDQWVDFVVYAKWSYTSSGVLKVWMNDVLVIDKQNSPNTYNDQTQEFLGFGIYNSWWSIQQPPSPVSYNLYFDNVRVADSTGSFADVDPSL